MKVRADRGPRLTLALLKRERPDLYDPRQVKELPANAAADVFSDDVGPASKYQLVAVFGVHEKVGARFRLLHSIIVDVGTTWRIWARIRGIGAARPAPARGKVLIDDPLDPPAWSAATIMAPCQTTLGSGPLATRKNEGRREKSRLRPVLPTARGERHRVIRECQKTSEDRGGGPATEYWLTEGQVATVRLG
jgi:hypothetical protein